MGPQAPNSAPAEGRIKIGLVSSLDALPLMQSDVLGTPASGHWSAAPCQAYSNIVHQLLNGTLQGGLVPFDLFAAHLLGQGQELNYKRWAVLGVHVRCSWEFLVGHHAHRWLGRAEEGKAQALAMGEFRVAMGGSHPIVKRRVDRWMKKHKGDELNLTYHVLPVKLMRRAIENGAMDGVALPAPWGYAAQYDGIGMVEPTLEQNGWDLGMMLVVDREAVSDLPKFFREVRFSVNKAADKVRKMSHAEIARLFLSRDLFGGVTEEVMLQAMEAAAVSQPMVFDVPPEHLSSRLTLLEECGMLNAFGASVHDVAASLLRGLR